MYFVIKKCILPRSFFSTFAKGYKLEAFYKTIQLIKTSKIKQTELARRTGLTPTAINRWVNRQVDSIRPSNVENVAEALGKKVIWKNNGRTDCEFQDIIEETGTSFMEIKTPGMLERIFELEKKIEYLTSNKKSDVNSKIDWYLGFGSWLQLQIDLDYSQENIIYPIRNAFEGTAYSWIEILGYRKRDLISKDYLSFLHEDDKNSTIQRSHELAEIYEQNKSPILESDVIHRLKNKNGDFIQLFCHIRANLELKQSKMWCVPLPDNER